MFIGQVVQCSGEWARERKVLAGCTHRTLMEHSQVAGGQLASLMGKVDVDNLKMTRWDR